jgi:cytochrome c peroxidase
MGFLSNHGGFFMAAPHVFSTPKGSGARQVLAGIVTALMAGFILAAPALAAAPLPLNTVPIPEPANLLKFVKDKNAAIRLGKALFWDMQLGSDGFTACASCHFHAGADNRVRNQLSPGLQGGDVTFQAGARRPDTVLTVNDFPFFMLADPEDRFSARLRNVNDVVSSQGVVLRGFEKVTQGRDEEPGRNLRDSVFARDGRNLRRVEPRNAPTVINAVFNFSQFFDGRASHFFNGVNPFGNMDVSAQVWINNGGLQPLNLTANPTENEFLLDMASLASQAVGPPLSDFEMSWLGRSWPDIGRKMLSLRPLAKQEVHGQDSTLAVLRHSSGKGLNTTYTAMVQAAFRDEFWNSTVPLLFKERDAALMEPSRDEPRSFLLNPGKGQVQTGAPMLQAGEESGTYTQMESNFSLFFGLAVQLYQATLVSDDTPFDRFVAGDDLAMTERQQRGLSRFLSGGAGCTVCHFGSEFTGASITVARDPAEGGLIELMAMGDGNRANYDIGFYNIGVRPTNEDLGRGGVVSGLLDLDGNPLPLSFARQFALHLAGKLPFPPVAEPGCVNDFIAEPPTICPEDPLGETRMAVNGAFKTPGLRNIELTGPYMHNGGMATLMQVVDFYVRGGNFHEANIADLDPVINDINGMKDSPEVQAEMVDFLLALTDERVRWEQAPFDHPQLIVPNGHSNVIPGNPKRTRILADNTITIPAVGSAGRQAQGLPPLKPFLADNLEGAALSNFHFQQ